jgi:Xaa-Pro dipeptidase
MPAPSSSHSACRYVFVPPDGPVILFEFAGCEHIAAGRPAVSEIRPAIPFYYFVTAARCREGGAMGG